MLRPRTGISRALSRNVRRVPFESPVTPKMSLICRMNRRQRQPQFEISSGLRVIVLPGSPATSWNSPARPWSRPDSETADLPEPHRPVRTRMQSPFATSGSPCASDARPSRYSRARFTTRDRAGVDPGRLLMASSISNKNGVRQFADLVESALRAPSLPDGNSRLPHRGRRPAASARQTRAAATTPASIPAGELAGSIRERVFARDYRKPCK